MKLVSISHLRRVSLAAALGLFTLASPLPAQFANPQPDDANYGVTTSRIRVNSLGFLPTQQKRVSIQKLPNDPTPTEVWVVNTSDQRVYPPVNQPALQPWLFGTTTDSGGETIYLADFSGLQTPGRYRIRVNTLQNSSAAFDVRSDVYSDALFLATKAMHMMRCDAAVSFTWNGTTFSHARCHDGQEDGWMDYAMNPAGGVPSQPQHYREGKGGWHDAGDYNKYTTTGSFAAAMMLKAWDHYRTNLDTLDLDLPTSSDSYLPDFLEEIKWELDWLLKMRYPNGTGWVAHKLTTDGFKDPTKEVEQKHGFLPETDNRPRFYTPYATASTADFAAVMALASRIFRDYDSNSTGPDDDFANNVCLPAARLSWARLMATPCNVRPTDHKLGTGGYDNDYDIPSRLWAAAELFEAETDPTQAAACLQYFEQAAFNANTGNLNWHFGDEGPAWNKVTDLAFATYLDSSKIRDDDVVDAIAAELADRVATMCDRAISTQAYGRTIGGRADWGINARLAAQAYLLEVADRQLPADSDRRRAKLAILGYIFGRNFHARSFVTGLGHYPPQFIHDNRRNNSGDPWNPSNRFPWDNPTQLAHQKSWPGLLVGHSWVEGASNNETRGWIDKIHAGRNEPSIHSNSCLIYALAGFATF